MSVSNLTHNLTFVVNRFRLSNPQKNILWVLELCLGFTHKSNKTWVHPGQIGQMNTGYLAKSFTKIQRLSMSREARRIKVGYSY